MIVVFYFMLIRPQQIQQKKRQEMLASLRKGNHVVTVGGIYGEIVDIKEDALILKIADNVNVRTTKSAVGSVLGK
ncbi:MAG TPA: preprotein translocase subunit YajC, partial [Firmicutes bacterium]|nr:preprotein translocase subunit YajC [Bacillota bacterium]